MFRHRRSERVWKESAMFLAMNALGLGDVLTYQMIWWYVQGFTSFTAGSIIRFRGLHGDSGHASSSIAKA